MFVPEDGTGLPDANSLVSVETADGFFAIRDPKWATFQLEEKQRCLVLATDYIGNKWDDFDFKGVQLNPGIQALYFPREAIQGDLSDYPFKPVPDEIVYAVCMYAMVVHDNNKLAYPVLNTGNGQIVMESSGAGPLAEKYQYAEAVSRDLWSVYPEADARIKKLLVRPKGMSGRLYR